MPGLLLYFIAVSAKEAGFEFETGFELGGAKGIRTPDLLHAMHGGFVALRS
jgi:hypothetical protein